MALRVSLEWLGSCSGCEISFLNMGEELISLLTEHIDIVHAPLLMDHKYLGQTGDAEKLSLPEADVGFVSGGAGNTEHLDILEEMRRKCKVLVAIGTCATHGGIPALMNGQDRRRSWQEIFQTVTTDPGSAVPDIEVPGPLDRVYGCDEKTTIDLLLPGCPPNPSLIREVIMAQVEEREMVLPQRSVCETCPAKREGKGEVAKVRRFLVNARYKSDEELETMRCLLEQGFMCLGPVTLAGCAGTGAPRCIHARVPCRGCYGPVRRGGNQMLDMMNAMASNGIQYKTVVDRRSILRFSGAHGRLRPLKKRE
ncbi:methyl viologen-reducing hydrogenase [Desulfopila inferna]|uniref:NADH-quinone oxidoreductase subunit B family protein n=1 Tax=Desulfopila inferna TaxID=468528 RepID=UPI0019660902|nr:methyl viologen-reducing hydrogenase [Desulfopila inferna]MBM9603430.1 methyl viologen-reducing hydrogenase [Desulfopila inferna]